MQDDDRQQFDTLPPALVEALREMDGPAVLPDAERDADVLSGARRHLAQHAGGPSRKRRNWRLFIGGAAGGAVAAAAMVGIVVLLGDPAAEPPTQRDVAQVTPNSPQPTAARPGDLNLSGNLDILDAYTLAKQIERGDAPNNADLNSDGQIDQQDIDWIAHRAVALNLGGQG